MSSLSGESDGYIFARDQKASIRLNYHHWIVKETLGYLIHPSIPTNRDGMRILDVATGTGLWPIKVSRSLQGAQVHGFDISARQFPDEKRLPSNVYLYEYDLFEPIPQDLYGKYNIVHSRFFVTLIDSPEKIAGVLENLLTTVKPGGYLQWVEPDPDKNRVVTPDGVKSNVTQGFMEMIKKQWPGIDRSWVSNLGNSFTSQGMADVIVERKVIPEELLILSHHQMCMGFEEFRTAQLSNGATPEAARKMRETLDGLNREFAAGASVQGEYVVTTGQKPF